ncbi:DoxX family protein [Rhodococcus sp. NPDC057529]
MLAALRKVAPVPNDDELIVRANGAVQAFAGATLALGLYPRVSALALAGSLVPTTVAGHGFWSLEVPTARKMQRVQFQKNVAMLGGLLYAARDTSTSRS